MTQYPLGMLCCVSLVVFFVFFLSSERNVRAQKTEKVEHYFQDLSFDLPTEEMTAVAVDPGDSEVFYAGSDGFLFKSDDGGESWRVILSFPVGLPQSSSDLNNPQNNNPLNQSLNEDDIADLVRDIAEESGEDFDNSDDDQNRIFLEDETGIELNNFKTLFDFGQAAFYDKIGVRSIRFVSATSAEIYVSTPRGLFYSKNAGQDFVYIDIPGGVESQNIKDCLVITEGRYDLLIIASSGVWLRDREHALFTHMPESEDFDVLSLSTAEKNKPHHFILGTSDGVYLFNSDDLSFEHLILNGVDSSDQSVHAVAYDAFLDQIYAAHGDELFTGHIAEKHLYPVTTIGHHKIIDITVNPFVAGEAFLSTFGVGVLKTVDIGRKLETMEHLLPAATAASIVFIKSSKMDYLVASERGIFRSVEGVAPKYSLEKAREYMELIKREPSLELGAQALLSAFQLTPENVEKWQDRQAWSVFLPRFWFTYKYILDDDYTPNSLKWYQNYVSSESFNTLKGNGHLFQVTFQWYPEKWIFNNTGYNKRKVHQQLYMRQTTLIDHYIKTFQIRRDLQEKIWLKSVKMTQKQLYYNKLKYDAETAILNGMIEKPLFSKLWEHSL